ncbi:LAT2 domain-containing protein isoform X1 [Ictalurus punctatus]|uniref:LAT2 domain-containing protein isoform X1 n=1 Tax=Ictalurus punctatus TaxID=7998 RepID=A0A2D0T2I6_ICTPU|nr:LAT2 domain-containing protein isoform X1 [Ictalurus punctatus]
MIEVTSLQGAVLAFLSVSTVSFICALCIRCRKKTMIVQESNQLYVPQIFHRGGSKFAVTRSKTVTRTNQMSTNPCQSSGEITVAHTPKSQLETAVQDQGGSYENIKQSIHGSMEPTYVDPISTPPHNNNVLHDDDIGDYANIFPTQDVQHDSDSYDYENTEFLQNSKPDDDDEPDYVNADTANN